MISSELDVTEVADRVFAVVGRDGTANSGFVVGDESVALIDAQASPRLGSALREAINAVTSVPVRYAVLSHHHGDHLFGLQAWPELVVLAHPECVRVLQQLAPEPGERVRLSPDELLRIFVGAAAAGLIAASPDHPINRRLRGPDYADVQLCRPRPIDADPFVLDLGGVQVQVTAPGPAHGTDDLLVDVPGRAVRFLGDLGFVRRLPAVTATHVDAWARVTASLMAHGSATIVPGHGPVAAPDELADQLAYLRALADLRAGTNSATGWERFARLPGFDRWHDINVAVVTDAGRDEPRT